MFCFYYLFERFLKIELFILSLLKNDINSIFGHAHSHALVHLEFFGRLAAWQYLKFLQHFHQAYLQLHIGKFHANTFLLFYFKILTSSLQKLINLKYSQFLGPAPNVNKLNGFLFISGENLNKQKKNKNVKLFKVKNSRLNVNNILPQRIENVWISWSPQILIIMQ